MRMLLSATVGLLGLVAISGAAPASATTLDQQTVLAGFAAPSPALQFGAPVTDQLVVANDQSDSRRRRRRHHHRRFNR
ncbi:hypothetical protein [Plastoroseomonas arctica]|uniref:Uncharacterized protein n=1 Tax=Plastoroseomonas arctica TaxID=1509237 RepID=A0AAF1KHP1_9PROT|nr:hypothetical protein [Plastoroseomonas arctica]MBR0654149.1 hypothetical protein [Plastoroseomonas arctica]